MRLDWRLRECDYGEMNGMPRSHLESERGSRIDVPFPGGESWGGAVGRVTGFSAKSTRRAAGSEFSSSAMSRLDGLSTITSAAFPSKHYRTLRSNGKKAGSTSRQRRLSKGHVACASVRKCPLTTYARGKTFTYLRQWRLICSSHATTSARASERSFRLEKSKSSQLPRSCGVGRCRSLSSARMRSRSRRWRGSHGNVRGATATVLRGMHGFYSPARSRQARGRLRARECAGMSLEGTEPAASPQAERGVPSSWPRRLPSTWIFPESESTDRIWRVPADERWRHR